MHKKPSRMFIGLDLAGQDKLAIASWREKHLSGIPDKPVPVENFHITLAFLGQVSSDKIEALEQGLAAIESSAMTLTTTELGCFIKPQILYLGVQLSEPLARLAKACRALSHNLGLATQYHSYQPHITLSRKHREPQPVAAPAPQLPLSFKQFHLFESVSAKQAGAPPRYLKRLSFDLQPNWLAR